MTKLRIKLKCGKVSTRKCFNIYLLVGTNYNHLVGRYIILLKRVYIRNLLLSIVLKPKSETITMSQIKLIIIIIDSLTGGYCNSN